MKTCKKGLHTYPKDKKQCPECKKTRCAKYYLTNLFKIKQYYVSNLAKIKQDMAQYYTNNVDKIKYIRMMHYLTNVDKINEQHKKYYLANINKVKKQHKQYYLANIDKVRQDMVQWQKAEKLSNPLFKLRCNLNSLISGSLKKGNFSKSSRTHQLLNCSYMQVQQHLIASAIKRYGFHDSNFKYHIDHIIPCSIAKNEEELIKLQHYTNLQYLTPKDNLRKSDSWDGTVENESWNLI